MNKEIRKVKTSEKRKNKKLSFHALSTISIVVALCLVVLINIFINVLVTKYPNVEIDLTSSQTYKLQDDTIEYLSQNTTPIDIYILQDKTTFINALGGVNTIHFVQADKLIRKMAATNKNISYKYMDISENPTFVSKYPNINWNSSMSHLILVDAGDNNYTTLTLDDCFTYDEEQSSYYGAYYFTGTTIEQAITSAVLTLTSSDKVIVNYITGCGQEDSYYTYLNTLLKANAYELEEVSVATGKLNKDASIAVLFAPTVDLSEDSISMVDEWLTNDGAYGKTLIYFPHYQKFDTPNLDALLEQYGMKISDGLAFTTSTDYYINNTAYSFITDYASDIYTATLKNPSVPVVMDGARGIEVLDDNMVNVMLNVPSGAGVVPYDTDASSLDDFITADGVNVAAIGTKTNDENVSSNIAVFGSGNMISNSYLSNSYCNNANYIVNLCNTVTNRGDMGITITSASAESEAIEMVADGQKTIYYTLFVGIIPVIVLIIGIVIFIRRRFL